MTEFTLEEKRRLAEMMGLTFIPRDKSSFVNPTARIPCDPIIPEIGGKELVHLDPENNPAHTLLAMERLEFDLLCVLHKWEARSHRPCEREPGGYGDVEVVSGYGSTPSAAVAACCKKLVERKETL